MIARIKPQGKEWAVQLGYNPINLICETASRIGYQVRLWPTRKQADRWAIENGFTLEQGEHNDHRHLEH